MEDWTLPSIGASFKKWRCCTHNPPRSPGPCYMQGPQKERRTNFFIKNGLAASCHGCAVQAAGDQRSRRRPRQGPLELSGSPPFFCFVAPFFSHVINSSSLARAHACLAQTSTHEIYAHAKLIPRCIWKKNII
jgi:hypothetical protein